MSLFHPDEPLFDECDAGGDIREKVIELLDQVADLVESHDNVMHPSGPTCEHVRFATVASLMSALGLDHRDLARLGTTLILFCQPDDEEDEEEEVA